MNGTKLVQVPQGLGTEEKNKVPGLQGSALHWAGFLFASGGLTERMEKEEKSDIRR